jgi:hypothetical protein
MDIYTEQILNRTVQIKAKDIYKTKNIDGIIAHKLKKFEGKCTKSGYILEDSIQIIQRSVGKVYNINRESYIEYKINYKIKSILPKIGEKYECIIGSITKMGLICYIELPTTTNISDSPLLIIIPKEYCEIDKYKNGDKVTILTIDLRIKFMATQIQLIGKIED